MIETINVKFFSLSCGELHIFDVNVHMYDHTHRAPNYIRLNPFPPYFYLMEFLPGHFHV